MNKIYALLAAFLLAGSAFAAVNINTATQTELEALPEVGPARAQAIIDYRTKNGPFKSGEDLKKVDGVGDKNFMDMKDKISTSGPTKIDWKSDAKKDAPKADAGKAGAPAAAAGTAAAPKADAGKVAAPAAAGVQIGRYVGGDCCADVDVVVLVALGEPGRSPFVRRVCCSPPRAW